MKRYMTVLAAIVIVIAMVGGAYAAGSVSEPVAVTATVSGLCKVGTSGAMSFAIPDPSAAGPIPATIATPATVLCSNTTPYTVTAASANAGGAAATCAGPGITGQLKDASANTMNYTFTCSTPGTGLGFGNPVSLGIAGSILQAAYINAAASATYADTVTLTISY
jgi:spore coat protein U-like protein